MMCVCCLLSFVQEFHFHVQMFLLQAVTRYILDKDGGGKEVNELEICLVLMCMCNLAALMRCTEYAAGTMMMMKKIYQFFC